MKQKMSPCCARRISKLHMDQADLARVARRANMAPESPRWRERIAQAKVVVAQSKQAVVDHEAEHAGDEAA